MYRRRYKKYFFLLKINKLKIKIRLLHFTLYSLTKTRFTETVYIRAET